MNNVYSKILNSIFAFLQRMRGVMIRTIKPANGYKLFPISSKFGFDRGKPIDRMYIEMFLQENSNLIMGKCLEIHDKNYIEKYGSNRVTTADILDVDTKNEQANIYADLADAHNIKSNTYDTLIITHTIGLIPEHEKAIAELYRILKPGGSLLLTVAALSPFVPDSSGYWRYTAKSVNFLLGKYFSLDKVKVESYGNALAGQAFWVGMSQEDIGAENLKFNDKRYPVIISAVAKK